MNNFADPNAVEPRYFEDYIAGTTYKFGPILVEAEEIMAFARRFDPQPFHTDPEAAQQSMYGGLIASGWHTAGLMMRLIVTNHYLSPASSLGSPGVDEIRWLQPVRPGDLLSVRVTVLETTPSRSRPDRGIIRSFIEVVNQEGQVVMSMKAVNFMRRRAEEG